MKSPLTTKFLGEVLSKVEDPVTELRVSPPVAVLKVLVVPLPVQISVAKATFGWAKKTRVEANSDARVMPVMWRGSFRNLESFMRPLNQSYKCSDISDR